jgi:hypothetical protein
MFSTLKWYYTTPFDNKAYYLVGLYPSGTSYYATVVNNPQSSRTLACLIGGSVTTTTTSTTTTTTTTAAPSVDIYIGNVLSLDITITGMRINGVAVTWSGAGPDLPIASGDNGSFTSTQTGVQEVQIDYSTTIPGQHIIFTDSDAVQTCSPTSGGGSSTMVISSAQITAGSTIYVTCADGACP